jgi:hypothetical protein
MAPGLRNTLAVIAGFLLGSAVNMGLIMAGSALIPPPAGVDVTDTESLQASIHLFEAKHFVTPFVAHAGGTLAGAVVAYVIAVGNRMAPAWILGAIFFAGGIYASRLFPAPGWFVATDLVLAYFPMAWLAIRIGQAFADNKGVTA